MIRLPISTKPWTNKDISGRWAMLQQIGGLALSLNDRYYANVSLQQVWQGRYPPPPDFPSDTSMSNYTLNNFDTFAS
jgi:hypothetical protein